jgi:hypothetical protein
LKNHYLSAAVQSAMKNEKKLFFGVLFCYVAVTMPPQKKQMRYCHEIYNIISGDENFLRTSRNYADFEEKYGACKPEFLLSQFLRDLSSHEDQLPCHHHGR